MAFLSSRDVEHFLNLARNQLTGSSDHGIKMALYEVIREFLGESYSWVEHISLLVTAGTQSYLLTPRNGGQIISLLGVWDGLRVGVRARMPDFGTLIVDRPINVSSVSPTSDATATLSAQNPWLVVVAKNIDLPKTRDELPIAPEFVLKVYGPVITAGVYARMMLEPGKSYSDKAMAALHMREFRDGIGVARANALHANLMNGQAWRFPQGFRVTGQRGGVSTAWPTETL